jgi:hypothetical protein
MLFRVSQARCCCNRRQNCSLFMRKGRELPATNHLESRKCIIIPSAEMICVMWSGSSEIFFNPFCCCVIRVCKNLRPVAGGFPLFTHMTCPTNVDSSGICNCIGVLTRPAVTGRVCFKLNLKTGRVHQCSRGK